VRGVVLLPDGSPAASMQVALLTPEKGITLGRAKFLYARDGIVVKTDTEGRFQFPFQTQPSAVVAADSQGFGLVRLNRTNRDVSITLGPWARIEGSLKLRRESNAGRDINLQSFADFYFRGSVQLDNAAFSVKTDEQGNFVMDHVPAGDFNLYLFQGMGIPYSHQTPVQLQPGETVRVQIGGAGATVSGRFALSDASKKIDWGKQAEYSSLATKLPPLPVPRGLKPEQLQKWHIEYAQSPEGLARQRAGRSYPLTIAADGSFSVEDVPPGTYVLMASFSRTPIDPGNHVPGSRSDSLGSVRQDVVVPELASDQSTGTLDLGTLTITVH
jgi:hypothetical protein